MTDSPTPHIEINGRATEADPLLFEMLSGQGHFTAMQVRGGRVRGLDLHLRRLDAATRELFGVELDGEVVRGRIRHALRERSHDAAVRVYVYRPEPGDGPVTVITVRPPVPEPEAAQRLRSVAYQRPAAHLKHLGGFGQRYHRDRVQQEGYDEALLVAPDGAVAEGAITNIGFIEGATVVWPDAPALQGTTMLVLRRELDRAGISWAQRPVHTVDLASFDGAFVCNSQGVAAVSAIDNTRYSADTELVRTVRSLYGAAPWDEI
ncbi:class IV aminotransferase [Streptomyces platensis]|uniref:Class IV aminotransferase n=1 Tax=Streptomyces platensis TaxID=58346 RepID=A0AAE6NRR7_STRPT|nr:aminotransferase class IV [Streptomyces platensis]OSY39945.1 hypothetical protein BG653_05589 [Streptomyces platensis]QEV56391.1 class IV aminotransferase [Streptomyces platensis]